MKHKTLNIEQMMIVEQMLKNAQTPLLHIADVSGSAFDLPEIGKIYNCFDDGKIRESRMYAVEISEIIPFDKIDKETLEKWKEQVNQCQWLYEKETDYFIKTINGEDGDAVFVRTKNIGWFSIGTFMNSGRLDIDGSLTESLSP